MVLSKNRFVKHRGNIRFKGDSIKNDEINDGFLIWRKWSVKESATRIKSEDFVRRMRFIALY
jgi:hypothetical protein